MSYVKNIPTMEWDEFDHSEYYTKRMQDVKLKNGDIIYNCYPNAGVWIVMQKGKNEKYYGKDIPVSETVSIRLTHEKSWDND